MSLQEAVGWLVSFVQSHFWGVLVQNRVSYKKGHVPC